VSERYGIIVSKPGYDATTATAISGLAIHDQIQLLKIKSTAKITLPADATTAIPHGLGYIPVAWVFIKTASNDLHPVYYNTSRPYAYVDETNLEIANSYSGERDFYYYIFYDKISK